jgi:monothiol glutaredoxin
LVVVTDPTLKEKVEELIRDNPVLLLMKGTPESPGCGNSMRAIAAIEPYGVEYAALDVLPALEPLRDATGEIADWRTFPQLYVNGELVGGADIVEEMHASGELAEVLGVEAKQGAETPAPAQPDPDRPVTQSPPMQIDNS